MVLTILHVLVDICIGIWLWLVGRYVKTDKLIRSEKRIFIPALVISIVLIGLYFVAFERAKISITSSHEGAWVFIDGKRIGPVEKGKAIVRNVKIGKHIVRLNDASGFFDDNIQEEVLVGWGTRNVEDLPLFRKKGNIYVNVYPEGEVKIRVNGVDKGTDYVLKDVEAGAYQIEALYMGKTKTKLVTFYGGERDIFIGFPGT